MPSVGWKHAISWSTHIFAQVWTDRAQEQLVNLDSKMYLHQELWNIGFLHATSKHHYNISEGVQKISSTKKDEQTAITTSQKEQKKEVAPRRMSKQP